MSTHKDNFKKHYVYALIDPRPKNRWKDYKNAKSIFYIGKGKWNKQKGDLNRYLRHMRETRHKKISYKCNVIRKIWASDLEVGFKVVSRWNTEKEAYAEEERVIKEIKLKNLTNVRKGGIGKPEDCKNNRLSEEHKKNIGAAMKGKKHSEEHKRNIGIAMKGKNKGIRSEEHKRKLSEAQKKRWVNMSKEKRESMNKKISKINKGKRFSEAQKKKISNSQKLRWKKIKSRS